MPLFCWSAAGKGVEAITVELAGWRGKFEVRAVGLAWMAGGVVLAVGISLL